MLKALHNKEIAQVEKWKKDNGDFLEEAGVDRKFVDEFLECPTREKLEELKKKSPGIFK